MRKHILFLMLIAVLLLTGCGSRKTGTSSEVPVLVETGDHYQVEDPCRMTEPGENLSFRIDTDENYTVTAADYSGDYTLTVSDGATVLALSDIRYPVRVKLTLSHDSRTIAYHANGGKALTQAGTEVTVTYDVSVHARPNVSIGTDLFTRDGYTLTGWNTSPDGSGQRVGLGSRMTVEESVQLYAQWAEWTPAEAFSWEITDGNAMITACSASGGQVVVPEEVDGYPVTGIAAYAFADCPAETVILPKSLQTIEEKAFAGASLRDLHFFDNIEFITDACFASCENLSTLYISAIEDPYGYSYRRESLLADKMDLLIQTMGEKRIIFYGGCSMWYNLNGSDAQEAFEDQYTVVNMGLNGACSSLFQMELIRNFVTDQDILFHTPEISSSQQLLTDTSCDSYADKLWCGLEYNYDLVSLVDIREFDGGVLEGLRSYLDKKKPGGSYLDIYQDSKGNSYLDGTGSIPFDRTQTLDKLADTVEVDPAYLADLSRLRQEYSRFTEKGIPVYVSYAAFDYEQVAYAQRSNLDDIDQAFLQQLENAEGVTVVGSIEEFLFRDIDCYDTVWHLLTEPARRCTAAWVRDLKEAMTADGLWTEESN